MRATTRLPVRLVLAVGAAAGAAAFMDAAAETLHAVVRPPTGDVLAPGTLTNLPAGTP
ncbi:hypothetical protein AB0I52_25325 [Streptomyces sp. NPDC050423]|uniref:hypothetical protein n=1 Tax=Streptomyces sp. NPDC050423 TaxID=3155402 RepID=UPI003444BE70